MNRWALAAAAAVVTVGITACGAKLVVVPVPSEAQGAAQAGTLAPAVSKLQGEGVFYALPRTVARVVVKADKVVTQSAPYARFAPIFAPGAEPPCGTIVKCAAVKGKGETTKYELQQGATFTPFGE